MSDGGRERKRASSKEKKVQSSVSKMYKTRKERSDENLRQVYTWASSFNRTVFRVFFSITASPARVVSVACFLFAFSSCEWAVR